MISRRFHIEEWHDQELRARKRLLKVPYSASVRLALDMFFGRGAQDDKTPARDGPIKGARDHETKSIQ